MNREQDGERMALQEARLRFTQFDTRTAWDLGLRLKAAAEARGATVAIEIRIAKATVFAYAMPGTTPANGDWARRKCNAVELIQQSSYAIGNRPLRDGRTTLQRMGLSTRDYADDGGAFPLFVEGVGCIGVVAVSGLPQREDHALIVEVLGEICGVSLEGLRLD